MTKRLAGKTAVVTGGARGIGASIGHCLADAGARVGLIDLDGEVASETASKLATPGCAAAADCSESEAMEAAVKQLAREMGGLDIMVNNAGARAGSGPTGAGVVTPPISNLSDADWDSQIQNNLRTCFVGSKVAIPHLAERGGGSVVNISSIAGLRGSPQLPAYGAAKAAVLHLTKTLALELSPQNIRVNAICPGLLWTRAWEELTTHMKATNPELADMDLRDIFLGVVRQLVPLGREQTPEDIGHLVTFLCSDVAASITGQDISVDGGITLGPPSVPA